jgi:hypothetical protein
MPANRSIVAGITYLPPAAAFLTAAMDQLTHDQTRERLAPYASNPCSIA